MNILLAFVFLLGYYYFVLRRYNTLGFRIFSLCFFVSAAMIYWWWGDWSELKKVASNGISTRANVLEKSKDGANNIVMVAFLNEAGNLEQRVEHGGISDEEFDLLELNSATAIRYSPYSKTFFLEKSFQRQRHDLP